MMHHRTLRRGGAAGTARAGFSLIELLAVIIIVALLFAFLIPNLLSSKDAVNSKMTGTWLDQVSAEISAYARDKGDFPPSTFPRKLDPKPSKTNMGVESLLIALMPADGSYLAGGDYDDRLLVLEPRHLLPDEIEEGMGFEGLPPGCNPSAPKDRLYFISDIYPEHVVLDGNHPLAGIALRISLKVHAVREAREDEIGQGTLGTGFFRMQVDAPDELQGPGLTPPGPHTLH